MLNEPQYELRHVLRDMWAHLGQMFLLERRMLGIIASYAVGIGLLFLCVPIAVQELVSTFSFAMEARMVFTLAGAVLVALLGVAYFRERQARAVETLQQRAYARIAVAFTTIIPAIEAETAVTRQAARFMEADLLTRALVMMTADLFNVVVAGTVAVCMLMFSSPAFLAYLGILFTGFIGLLVIFGRGGFLVTLRMSQLHYGIFHWIQNIADNAAHLRAVDGRHHLLKRTDELLHPYLRVRQQRSDTLTGRQYKASAFWLAFGHAGLIVTAGLLVVEKQITVGQFAGAEVLVGNLLVNMDTLARRMVAVFFMFTSLRELAGVFSLPRAQSLGDSTVPLPVDVTTGMHLTCRAVSFVLPPAAPLFEEFECEIAAGEKVVILTNTSTAKTAMAKVLAGLVRPTAGVVRYHDVNVVEVDPVSISRYRAVILDSQPTLIDGTVEDNISLGRPGVTYQDMAWALRFVELEEEMDALPKGIQTSVHASGVSFTLSQILRVLLARAIVTRPPLLIFDGTLHSMLPSTREVILRRLCSKEEPWSVVFVSNDPTFSAYVDRQIRVESPAPR